jgi:hypothetical protein
MTIQKYSRTQFINQLSILTGATKHNVDRMGVLLNKAGMLLSGGRGPNAPDLTPKDLTNIVLGMLGAEKTSTVVEVVNRNKALKSERWTLGEALIKILSDHKTSQKVLAISVCRNYPEAKIEWADIIIDENGFSKFENEFVEIFRSVDDAGDYPGLRIDAELAGHVLSVLTWEFYRAKFHKGVVPDGVHPE